jgi:DNA-binding helix-hairpin-helix protein with protein kinase domain
MPDLQGILKSGTVIRGQSSSFECTVRELLGGGGQGEVYRVDGPAQALALKWYLPHAATTDQRALLENLIRKGPPNARFLWPLELASTPSAQGYGYFMALREPRFRGLVELMKRRIDPTFRVLLTAGFHLADSFLQLHSKGLCYRDISFGNLFLDPATGEVRICDNDNVAVDGDRAAGILGTPRFMAPEVVRGASLPSIQTDLYSLAVLLFYLFMVHHPLEGKREFAIHSFDLPAMTDLYGNNPVFIFDPVNDSNRPVRGYHDNVLANWPVYPQFFRDLFIRSFTEGIRDPAHGRVREGEWRAALVRMRDSIVYCSNCGAECFFDRERTAATGCWSCGSPVRLPFRIRIGRSQVMLNFDTQLFPHHIDEQRQYDFSAAVAGVSRHPNDPNVWGLTNLSGEVWSFQAPHDSLPVEVSPGRTAPLASGGRINFGKAEGEVCQ